MSIAVGDKAPDFTLESTQGERVALADLLARAKHSVVVFFYPKDDTPGCTAEACGFRDLHEEFARAGADVVGISSDSADSHRRFAGKHGLPMKLLSDPDGRVRRLYGVKATLGILPGRETFVLDRRGVVRHRFASQLRVGSHVQQALAVVRQIAGEAHAGDEAATGAR
ncbi:MAG TPA: peroxiredoxin [Polyangiaceae bacterium]|nr:peroxiredoxin [Polyangiaceae bacterium]